MRAETLKGHLDMLLIPVAALTGLGIAWLDSQPWWDDTGVTAGALVCAAGAVALVAPRRVWLWALVVGVWIPLHAIATNGDFRMLLVLLFPLMGAYGGMGLRQLTTRRGA